jgi:CheY-like chemotaxis protein
MANLIIVDDDLRLIATYELILGKSGHRVIATFTNGKELLHFFQSRMGQQKPGFVQSDIQPDVILMDYRMPQMDGLESAKRLRKIGVGAKIILISAFEIPDSQKDYYDILLQKPVVAGKLLEAVSAAQMVNA